MGSRYVVGHHETVALLVHAQAAGVAGPLPLTNVRCCRCDVRVDRQLRVAASAAVVRGQRSDCASPVHGVG